ncbi:MAG: RNA 3'-terminal phosphate cyclase [Planctomycetota bacterium]|jgi:RNA 3'-terminal phosphate cyclase (ATP)
MGDDDSSDMSSTRTPVELDGSRGEGGGQILRTALALSAATGRPFVINGIRANRPKPGLAAQHLMSVRAAAATCAAEVEGDRARSMELSFRPGALRPLERHFEVGTAGSVSLVLHAMALPLAMADGESKVSIGGGTHVEWSPPFEFLSPHWTGWMERCGLPLKVKLVRAGYYPKGGGLVRVRVPGSGKGGGAPKPLVLDPLPPGARHDFEFSGTVVITKLDDAIARRIARTTEHEMERAGFHCPVETRELDGPAQGVAFSVTAAWRGMTLACFSSIGRRGKPAEKVAKEAARAMLRFIESRAMLDPCISDQLVVPLSLAKGPSRYSTSEVTQHLLTNLETAAAFTGIVFEVKGDVGSPGEVRIAPGEA